MEVRYTCPYCEARKKADVPLTERQYTWSCPCGAHLSISAGNTFVTQMWSAPPKIRHLRLVPAE